MSELIDKLVADVHWRFTAAGRQFKPNAKEVQSWGGFVIHWSIPLLLWLPVSFLLYLLVASMDSQALLEGLLPFLIMAAPVGLFAGRKSLQRSASVVAYRKLLEGNERFVLSEYSKYLRRQITRAQADLTLGGPAEVARLSAIYSRLHALLKQGVGLEGAPLRSALAEEADMAEAVVQSYEEGRRDPLAELDARLPAELRQRIQELEREVVPPAKQPQAQ